MLFASLGLLIASQPTAPVTPPAPIESHDYELSPTELTEIEQEAERAANEGADGIERGQDRFDRQLRFCRAIPELPNGTDWTAVATAQIGRDEALGPHKELVERCLFYLTGRGEILDRWVAEDALQQQ